MIVISSVHSSEQKCPPSWVTDSCKILHTYWHNSFFTVWKQRSCIWRRAKMWLMQHETADTLAVWEPQIAHLALPRHLDRRVTGNVFSAGMAGTSTYLRIRQRSLFPPSYCCCETQSTVGCRWRWLAQVAYRHRNDLEHIYLNKG